VIAARAGFGAQLSKHGVELNSKKDADHQYFVDVLRKARALLCPLMSAASATPTAEPEQAAAVAGINRFDPLRVYEPSQEFLDAPELERPHYATGIDDDDEYQAEPQTSFLDAMVAYTMLLNDLGRIRSRVEWIWSNFRDGHFDAAAAAVATNATVYLAQGLIEEVVPMFAAHDGTWGMANMFFRYQAMVRGYTEKQVDAYAQNEDFNVLYELADETHVNAYALLSSLVKTLQPDRRVCLMYKEGMFGTYDPGSDRACKSGGEKH
jgi:hypothetical protein